MFLTSTTAPFTDTTAKGWKGVSTSEAAVARRGVPGRDALTRAVDASAIAQ